MIINSRCFLLRNSEQRGEKLILHGCRGSGGSKKERCWLAAGHHPSFGAWQKPFFGLTQRRLLFCSHFDCRLPFDRRGLDGWNGHTQKRSCCRQMRICLVIALPVFILLLAGDGNGMPALQISKRMWTVPVQAKIQLCRPKGQPAPSSGGGQQQKLSTADAKKTGWPLGLDPEKEGQRPAAGDNFDDIKRMMWMRKGWAQVPVGTDKPEASSSPAPIPECP